MSKKILIAILLIILVASGWYLFIKNYNYKITFKTAQSPGAIYATLAQWGELGITLSDSIASLDKDPFQSMSHNVFKNDSLFQYNWEFTRISDDTTKVTAYVKDEKNSLKQNIAVAFGKNSFTQSNTAEVRKLMEYFKVLDENFKISVVGKNKEIIPSKFIAYLPLQSKIEQKANTMRSSVVDIMGYIRKHDLELKGDPFIIVSDLNEIKGTIKFDFCFPIEEVDSLPPEFNVKFKKTPEIKALKANFYGNYRSTEFAWYELLRYAKDNNIEVLKQPVEIFKNDPQSGTDSNSWLAEVYMPIK